ncbi:MAG: DinB family protein [Thermoanaerobaculia bacterium]
MEIHELFVTRWEKEQPAFAKVIRALPEGKLDWRPHERSTSGGDLAWQLVLEQRQLVDLVESGETRWTPDPRPATAADIADAWDAATSDLRGRLAQLDAARAAAPAKLVFGGSEWSDSLNEMLWGYIFDMVHHRGQLSSYLRPMGAKVPAIYGPSGDSET